jgi:Domain of unknown function (DUF4412)
MLLKKAFVIPLFAAIFAIASRADLTITQQIEREAAAQPATLTMTAKIKEGKMRLDLNPQMSSIVDLKTGDMISLMHNQKLALTIPGASIKSLQQAYAKKAQESIDAKRSPPKSTGRKDKISGYACEEFETTAEGASVRLWITKELPNGEKLMSELSSLSGVDPFRGFHKDQQLPGFPIRTVVSGAEIGKTIVTVLEIRQDEIASSEFVVPESYRMIRAPALPVK